MKIKKTKVFPSKFVLSIKHVTRGFNPHKQKILEDAVVAHLCASKHTPEKHTAV